MTIADKYEMLPSSIVSSEEDKHAPRRVRKLKALASAALHAIPDEISALKETFIQAREDMARMRELQADPENLDVTRWDVVKYMSWRYMVQVPYQGLDDFGGLPAYLALKEAFGTPTAYLATNAASFLVAFTVGMGERKVQKVKANANAAQTTDYLGPMGHPLLDSTINSAPWNVMQKASKPREEGAPVELMTPAQIAAMSGAYGTVNTGFYAGSTAIPGLNSWQAFGVSLGVMYLAKGTIRGYNERIADESRDTGYDSYMHGLKKLTTD